MKKADYIIIAVVVFALCVLALVFTGKNKKLSKSPIEAVGKVQFDVTIKGATITSKDDIFKVGDVAFLTIRNVPYKDLKIVYVEKARRQVVIASPSKNGYAAVDDVSSPNQYDFIVRLEDNAKITSDGAVVGGNKIKIGIPVILESFNYKLGGTVSDVNVEENKE